MSVTTLSQNEGYEVRSRTISIAIHVLILLLAFLPAFNSMKESPPNEMVIEFVEQVVKKENKDVASSEISSSIEEGSPTPIQPIKEKVSSSSPANLNSVTTTKKSPIVASPPSEKKSTKEKATRNFGSLFGSSDMSDKNTSSGRKDLSKLSSVSNVSSKVGTGLKGRKITYAPQIEDHSQKTGKVVISICVNSKGKVVSSKYTQRGSTTTDKHLMELAEKSALKWSFSTSSQDRQCGVITIDFKLK